MWLSTGALGAQGCGLHSGDSAAKHSRALSACQHLQIGMRQVFGPPVPVPAVKKSAPPRGTALDPGRCSFNIHSLVLVHVFHRPRHWSRNTCCNYVSYCMWVMFVAAYSCNDPRCARVVAQKHPRCLTQLSPTCWAQPAWPTQTACPAASAADGSVPPAALAARHAPPPAGGPHSPEGWGSSSSSSSSNNSSSSSRGW
jgi:hypothetical protein